MSSYAERVTTYFTCKTGDGSVDELQNVIENQRVLLEWLRFEEQKFIDLREIRAITEKYCSEQPQVNQGQIAFDQVPPNDQHFFGLVNSLRKYITYFEDVTKRYESIVRAFGYLKSKESEYAVQRSQRTSSNPASAEQKAQLIYIDQSKKSLQEEKSMMLTDCRVDLAYIMTKLEETLTALNDQVQK